MRVLGAEFKPVGVAQDRPGVQGRGAEVPGASAASSRAVGPHHDADADVAELSPAALAAANKTYEARPDPSGFDAKTSEASEGEAADETKDATRDATSATDRKSNGELLTDEEQEQVQDLKERDRETRAHEQAHKSAAGRYAQGGPVFEFEKGPDGKRYAVGGHVNIDSSPVSGDPQATIQKMQVIRRAALAPSEPSSQDRKVAAQATRTEQKARAELRETSESKGESDDPASSPNDEPIGALLDIAA